MADITVRALGEDEWETFRQVRLSALRESPEAFVASHEEESALPESAWHERMRRSTRLLAEQADGPVGVASVSTGHGESGLQADLFGLWVSPAARGAGVARALVRAAAATARAAGQTHLTYWVGTDNGPAVAFASGIGFRPTDDRRPMRVGGRDGEEEISMVLPLAGDRGGIPGD